MIINVIHCFYSTVWITANEYNFGSRVTAAGSYRNYGNNRFTAPDSVTPFRAFYIYLNNVCFLQLDDLWSIERIASAPGIVDRVTRETRDL